MSGKKSCPSFTDFAAVTAHRTTVSPSVAITAPSAWRATLPVSSVSVSPPHSIDTFFTSNMWFPSPAGPYAGRGLCVRAVRPGAVQGVCLPYGGPAGCGSGPYSLRRPREGGGRWRNENSA
ncbi:protein of unknown function [uncultured Sphingopyxis sp.]|uniref:Uncharacterized protein n=1 Tax=uncultured Sphingopyxis sp. TaxID=310581 RepID=A0A1Y5PRU9_9SPHN|nr:protein of unknown function [uncultured Sphingopyxis sp.]